jgi:hypothetical protein
MYLKFIDWSRIVVAISFAISGLAIIIHGNGPAPEWFIIFVAIANASFAGAILLVLEALVRSFLGVRPKKSLASHAELEGTSTSTRSASENNSTSNAQSMNPKCE